MFLPEPSTLMSLLLQKVIEAEQDTESGAAAYSSEVVTPLSTHFQNLEERLGNTSLNDILMITSQSQESMN